MAGYPATLGLGSTGHTLESVGLGCGNPQNDLTEWRRKFLGKTNRRDYLGQSRTSEKLSIFVGGEASKP